jgi:Rad3-related DNA helicase
MGSFRRSLLGYRRADVDAALASRDADLGLRNERIADLEGQLPRIGELEIELSGISNMVVERERENRHLRDELQAANERHDRSLASLDAISERLEELHAQARGQATRIRMKALREAVEVSRRVQELADRVGVEPEGLSVVEPPANGNGHGEIAAEELFEGMVKVEIGPLGDFSQLVGFEDAAGRIGATREISVEKFSEGRATLSMRLCEPVALLRELEQRSPLDFRVRETAADRLILDVGDEPGAEQQAA